MGFYYGPGGGEPEEDKPGTLKEALVLTWVVFRVLAVPLAILFGTLAAIGVIIYLFILHWAAGVAVIALIVLALVARGVWEAKHPPVELR